MSVKYPRTPHLPWSEGRSEDDVALVDLRRLRSGEVVVTEKRDGENTTLTRDTCHARSLDSGFHPSRTWIRALWGQIRSELPEGMRICGENLYAVHSIRYEALTSYFEVFNVWDGDECLSWDDTLQWCELLGLTHVPVLHRGALPSEAELRGLWQERRSEPTSEGYVVRVAGSFKRAEFPTCVGKMVRAAHVQTDQHWMQKEVEPNGLHLPRT